MSNILHLLATKYLITDLFPKLEHFLWFAAILNSRKKYFSKIEIIFKINQFQPIFHSWIKILEIKKYFVFFEKNTSVYISALVDGISLEYEWQKLSQVNDVKKIFTKSAIVLTTI